MVVNLPSPNRRDPKCQSCDIYPIFFIIQEIFFSKNVLKYDVEHAIRLENHRKDIT